MGMFKGNSTTAAKPGVAKKAAGKPAKAVAKKAAARPRRDDDDEDVVEDGDGVVGGVTSGWGGAKKMAAEHSGFAARLSMKEETIVIRFLDDEPYANVATHWTQKRGQKKGEVIRRSYICLGKGKCPLCGIGDNPRVTYNFNVVQLTDGEPLVLSWEVGVKVYRQIEKKHNDPKYGPLSKSYYELERTGLGKDDTNYTLKVVRRLSDIEEFYPGLVVPTEAAFKKLVGYTVADVTKQTNSLKELREVAAELSGEEVEDDDDD